MRDQVTQLTEPTEVYGEIQYRDQAETGHDLWTLSGRQSIALEQSEGDKQRLRSYLYDLIDRVQKVEQPVCTRKFFPCRGLKFSVAD